MNLYSLFKKSRKNQVDFIFMISISSLPFLFYIYNLVPETKIWKTAFFEIDAGVYLNVNRIIWYLFVKIFTLFLLSLWYLSCLHKWKAIILFPIVAEISKLIFLIKSVNHDLGDEFFVLETLLYSLPYILSLIFISNKLIYNKKNTENNIKFNEEINIEIANLSSFNTKDYLIIKKDLIKLIKDKNNMDDREYLIKLIALRDRITF